MNLPQTLDELRGARTIQEANGAIISALESEGYDLMLFAILSPGTSPDAPFGFMPIRTFTSQWTQEYNRQRFYTCDPVKLTLPHATAIVAWQDLIADASNEGRMCLCRAIDAGMNNGIGIPCLAPCGIKAGIGAARSMRGFMLKPHARNALQAAADAYWLSFFRLYKGRLH